MSSREYILARFDMTRADLTQVLDHLTDADLPWKPAEDMKSVGELLLEIADKDREIIGWLKSGAWPDDEPSAFEPESSLEEMRAGLIVTREATRAYIAGLSDTELEEVLILPERWWEALRLLHCPRSEMLRNISAHEWYHTGQLIIYLWSQGRNPYGW